MKEYHELLRRVLFNGHKKGDRTGTGTVSVFGEKMVFDLSKEFPLVDTKKLYLRGIIHELLWFLKGDTNITYLNDNKVGIWDDWADEEGSIGPLYGEMWRSWPGSNSRIDQIAGIINELKVRPDSRRMVVNVWNPEFLPMEGIPPKDNPPLGLQSLAPCHPMFQLYSYFEHDKATVRTMDLQVYIRSNDLFLGAPFNIASYALLAHMIAQVCGMKVGKLHYIIGDAHIYLNHFQQVTEQLYRWDQREVGEAKPPIQISLNPEKTCIDDFVFDDFQIHNYNPLSAIPAPRAV